MSLDVYLQSSKSEKKHCFECGSEYEHRENLYSANITHNLGKMASEAGIYEALWRPQEKGWTKAGDIVEVLGDGLVWLKNDPEHFKQFNAPNGWGMYEHFVPFVEEYWKACKENPEAIINISR